MVARTGKREALALLLLFVLAFGAGFTAARSSLVVGSLVGPPALAKTFSPFWETWDLVQEHFVLRQNIDSRRMTYGAIRGMVSALGDPGHTSFLTPAEAKEEKTGLAGHFEGIGAEISIKGGRPTIVAPLDDSPALKAGIRTGDIIVRVDGKDVSGVPLPALVRLIRGPQGTEVRLGILHPGESRITELTIRRATIRLTSVAWHLVASDLAHVRIRRFSSDTGNEMAAAIRAALAGGARGFILDVRNDPGGLLQQAVAVTSQFLESGNVVLVEDARGARKPIPVEPGGLALGVPLVVLVNQGTASAAEIFAGAIQDAGRGPIIGAQSFGTGTVLTPYSLSDGSLLLLGTALWRTPAGHLIRERGIRPDIPVDLPPEGRLLTPAEEAAAGPALDINVDPQLARAVQVLRARAGDPAGKK